MAHAVADGEKILFHCTAGKDRTGITAMLLLGLAEVGDGHVLDDYEISARHQPEGRIDAFTKMLTDEGIDPDPFDLDAMLGSPRPVMRMTIDRCAIDGAGWRAMPTSWASTLSRRAAARANLRFAQP